MHPIKRPKASDTEDDIFSQEKEFLAGIQSQKFVPAATVIKKAKTGSYPSSSASSSSHTSEEKPRFAGESANSGTGLTPGQIFSTNFEEVEHPPEAVLLDVTEKPFDSSKLKDFGDMNQSALQKHIIKIRSAESNDDAQTTSKKPSLFSSRKKSLFARSFDASSRAAQVRCQQEDLQAGSTSTSNEPKDGVAANDISNISNSQQDEIIGEKIHPYLAGMTGAEILEEQRKLLERLDPKLVEFIRNRTLAKSSENEKPHTETVSSSKLEPMEVEDVNDDNNHVNISDLPIDPQLVHTFPGMQKLELSKLAWAGVIKGSQAVGPGSVGTGKTLNAAESKNARFDFTGLLICDHKENDQGTYDQALHHHGEEMNRPGYSVEELITLARSTNIQQRSIALDTLANIYSLAHTGIYDEVLEQSLFQLLENMEFIHVIRKGLDNSDSGSINSALSCLSALLYAELEEACLDATYLWPNSHPFPFLSTLPEEINTDVKAREEMKDFEFLQLDLGEFLISRADLLRRIEYLLTTTSQLLTEKGVTSILKILVRLARQCPSEIVSHDQTMGHIVNSYITPNWYLLRERDKTLTGVPLVLALKLIRILVESSASNATKLYHNYDIFSSVMAYLAYSDWRDQAHVQEVEGLVLESFKLWLAFLSHGLGIDKYVTFFPVVHQFLLFYGLSNELNSFDLHHSAHLYALLTRVVCFGDKIEAEERKTHSHWDLVKDATSLVEQLCRKLLKILSSPNFQVTFNIDLALLSLGLGLEFLNHTLKWHKNDDFLNRMNSLLIEFSHSDIFLNMTSKLTSHSVLLRDTSSKNRYPANFACIGALRWKGELNPAMLSNSPYHFLTYFVSFAKAIFQRKEDNYNSFFNAKIDDYLSKLRVCQSSSDQIDYFVRFELRCLYELLTFVSLTKPSFAIFPVTYKILVQVPVCCIDLFRKFLKICLQACCFSSDVEAVYQFYKSYFLSLNPRALRDNEQIKSCDNVHLPTKVRFAGGEHPGDDQAEESVILFKRWSQQVTEAHWIFHPLENLYRRVTSTPGYVNNQLPMLEQETRGCLSFIHQCLRHFHHSIIETPQDLVTIYCRICKIFMLGTPSVYLDETIVEMLTDILKILLSGQILSKFGTTIFSNHKPSRSAAVSFFDFYSELVNEFYENSYYNETFAAFLMLPLRSLEDLNLKDCFWHHEHLGFVRLSSEKIPVPSGYLTQFPEKDPKMLNLFTDLLKRKVIIKNRNPFLYEVLTCHLKKSVEFMTEELKKDLSLLSL